MTFVLANNPIDPAVVREEMTAVVAGGYCSFEGWVRDHQDNRPVVSLVYEAYESMALKIGDRIVAQTRAQYAILDARVVHRLGALVPGDLAVWIGVTAVHRNAAFAACRHLIDTIKAEVPIWKHEFYADGTDAWVDPTACDCATNRAGH